MYMCMYYVCIGTSDSMIYCATQSECKREKRTERKCVCVCVCVYVYVCVCVCERERERERMSE